MTVLDSLFGRAASTLRSVDRISILDGVIVAVGWCHPRSTPPRIILDGVEIPNQVCVRYARQDVVAVHGADYENSGFRLVAAVAAMPDDAEIAVRFGDQMVQRADIPVMNDVHWIRDRFCEAVTAKKDASLLELGSRARSGNTYKHLFPALGRYVGTDISDGPNVDVVADAHTLSEAINEQFDFAFSVSVFEHLIMPWVAAFELNKVLAPGGLAYIQSHPTWPLHEEPWDFFRFSKDAWTGLFNKLTGFEIVEAGYGIEAAIVPKMSATGALQNLDLQRTYLLSACVVRKIGAPLVDWSADPAIVYDLGYSH